MVVCRASFHCSGSRSIARCLAAVHCAERLLRGRETVRAVCRFLSSGSGSKGVQTACHPRSEHSRAEYRDVSHGCRRRATRRHDSNGHLSERCFLATSPHAGCPAAGARRHRKKTCRALRRLRSYCRPAPTCRRRRWKYHDRSRWWRRNRLNR
jgi:hypothetical protein